MVRIFDSETGKELWPYHLSAAPLATLTNHEIDGVQYLAVVAGGHDQLVLDRGDYLISFRLSPE